MQIPTALFFALSALVAAASPEVAPTATAAVKQVPQKVDPAQASILATKLTEHDHQKRALCVLGLCLGGSTTNYQTDVNNCGAAGKKCLTSWSFGSGSQCVAGVCFPATCNSGYALNSLTGQCQSVTSDVNNCGAIGNVCNVLGATGNTCISGSCFATACGTGYTYSSGVCNVKIDTTSDVNNCGAIGKKCGTYLFGSGSKCVSGICQPNSCNSGYTFSFASQSCVNTGSDLNNCGSVGNVCSFANGYGSCSSGTCKLSGCNSGFYNINGVCTNLNLQTDVNNCGSVGKVCSYANGVASCSYGNCQLSGCNAGYTMNTNYYLLGLLGSSSACQAVDTASDVNNCGAVGKVCTFANGSGKCANGVCTYSSCNSGFYNINNQCTALNLQSDVNNCGSVGNVCSYDNGVALCSYGQCQLATCNAGYTMNTQYYLLGLLGKSSACQAVNTLTDVNNCGSIGNKCAATYANGGLGSCVAGKCTATCNSGYAWDSSLAYCRDVSSDTNNCGSIGNVCSAVNGLAKCSSGKCAVSSCSTGYKLVNGVCSAIDYTSDPNNCGSAGKVCPSSYSNGGAGTCVAGLCTTTCNSGFAFDTAYSYCRDVRSDIANCGAVGNVCNLLGASSHACSSGSCIATACASGYTLKNGACSTLNLLTDVNNCGTVGNICRFSPTGATGECQAGKCVVTTCPTKYTLVSGVCVLQASQAARAKKSKIVAPRTLCPANEVACPIAGSSTYAGAVAQHFATGEQLVTAGTSGFECLDVMNSLDSCGGCASTGEGTDCSQIRGVQGVGCDAGKCVVFSCQNGWKVSLDGTKCVRSRAGHSASGNHTTHAKRHHSHPRHHHGGHAAHHS
ncbi:hypothetical protein JCM8547_007866 [Rhodosporidiobolus lusitaniae]